VYKTVTSSAKGTVLGCRAKQALVKLPTEATHVRGDRRIAALSEPKSNLQPAKTRAQPQSVVYLG
jgi:hypothetical protein